MEPIGIVGMGCRLPGADSPAAFWQLLANGQEGIREVPADRWPIDQFYDPRPGQPGKMSTRWGGFVPEVDRFDPSFFGISPREAERMDPQQRLLLEVVWEAIEDSGLTADQLSGSNAGVFVGIGNHDYARLLAQNIADITAYDGTGNTLCIAANRLSYVLNLRGPSMVLETACSSSLVALHYACQSLRLGECDLAIVGGVSLMLSPEPYITYSQAGMMAADGRCKTFDARADGYGRGEGAGAVILQRCNAAQESGRRIWATVQGSAVNQDGLSNGLTAPNGLAQQAVIRQALQRAEVTPEQISYVEAHGTGTVLGDPIEYKALKAVLMTQRSPDSPCWLGTAKVNVGHLEAAAGLVGLIKVALCLYHRAIPPHLHLQQLNPYISPAGTTFRWADALTPWPPVAGGHWAGLSSFGFGGTNAHAILSTAPVSDLVGTEAIAAPELSPRAQLLTLAAKTPAALTALREQYCHLVTAHPASFGDICGTGHQQRDHWEYRWAGVATNAAAMVPQLTAPSQPSPGSIGPIAFLFTGQGSQYPQMARQLSDRFGVFREALADCDRLLQPELGTSLLTLLEESDFASTAEAQPALVAIAYALAQLWRSWGIQPDYLLGHSLGEYAAALVAGAMDLETGLPLVAQRGRLMAAAPPGAMAAVMAAPEVVTGLLPAGVQIAAHNGPQAVTISGAADAITAALTVLSGAGYKTKRLPIDRAFHHGLMASILPDFRLAAEAVNYQLPQIPIISNLTGAPLGQLDGDYWCRHLLQPVQFAAGMAVLQAEGCQTYLEIGPRPTLITLGRQQISQGNWLASLHPDRDDDAQMLASLGELYQLGATVDWAAFQRDYPYQRADLPTYPFQRQRYWAAPSVSAPARVEPCSHPSADISDIYRLAWHPLAIEPPASSTTGGTWVIFGAASNPLAVALGQRLAQQHQRFVGVEQGPTYQRCDALNWQLDPRQPQHWQQFYQDLLQSETSPLGPLVYLWGWETDQDSSLDLLPLLQASVRQLAHLGGGFWVVTHQLAPIDFVATASPAASLLVGLCRGAALEYPQLGGGWIDLGTAVPGEQAVQILQSIDQIAQVEPQIAWRGDTAYGQRLLPQEDLPQPTLEIRPEANYLITGGWGALGLQVATWLVAKGAGYLTLLGRSAPSIAAQRLIQQWQSQGVVVQIAQLDLTEGAALTALWASFAAPLAGIIHAAGIAGYQPLLELSTGEWQRVLGAKVSGAWNLHQASLGDNLDFFVSFGSISGVWGAKGQAHYGAANCYLDALAYYRRGLGLPALTIDWGPWAAGGMAVPEFQQMLARLGITAWAPEAALALWGRLLGSGLTQSLVAQVDWTVFTPVYSLGAHPALFEHLYRPAANTPSSESPIWSQLQAATAPDRPLLLTQYLQNLAVQVLHLDQPPAPQVSLFDLGLDSLMALELLERLQRDIPVPIALGGLMQSHSVQSLQELIGQQCFDTVATPSPMLNLPSLAHLDGTIQPHGSLAVSEDCLLTGATGFLGAFLLAELLQRRPGQIYCLVRARDLEAAQGRLASTLSRYGLAVDWQRVIPVLGDLSQPGLGLSATTCDRLAHSIGAIYHSAATLNFIYPYSALQNTNVQGTQEIIRLASTGSPKILHYVSTDAVFDALDYYGQILPETTPLGDTTGIELGYTQSKWVAEGLVTEARDRGLPVVIYRPPLIAGDSMSGYWNTDDFTCRLLRGCIQLGAMPAIAAPLSFVPVDYVSRAIGYLSQQPTSLGQAFHLNNPHHTTWQELGDWIARQGYPLAVIPYTDWEQRLGQSDSRNSLHSLLPFFLRRWSPQQLDFATLAQQRPRLDCAATVEQLGSITCPPIAAPLLKVYFDYFQRCGFLPQPQLL